MLEPLTFDELTNLFKELKKNPKNRIEQVSMTDITTRDKDVMTFYNVEPQVHFYEIRIKLVTFK
jgi:hypothetical protein